MIPRFALVLLLLAAPSALRYRYTPGKTLRYHVVETTETIQKSGEQERKTVQETTMTVVSRTVASVGGKATVEESRVDGQMTTQSPEGKSARIVQPITRIFTLTPRGECLKVERRVAEGIRDPGQTFLEGLSFALPSNPIAPGATWSGAATTRGLDGKPLQIKYTSSYIAQTNRAGHPCAQINTTFSSALSVAGPAGPMAGSLGGTVAEYLATDLGRDVEIVFDLNLTLTSQAAGSPTTRIKSRTRQTLLK